MKKKDFNEKTILHIVFLVITILSGCSSSPHKEYEHQEKYSFASNVMQAQGFFNSSILGVELKGDNLNMLNSETSFLEGVGISLLTGNTLLGMGLFTTSSDDPKKYSRVFGWVPRNKFKTAQEASLHIAESLYVALSETLYEPPEWFKAYGDFSPVRGSTKFTGETCEDEKVYCSIVFANKPKLKDYTEEHVLTENPYFLDSGLSYKIRPF